MNENAILSFELHASDCTTSLQFESIFQRYLIDLQLELALASIEPDYPGYSSPEQIGRLQWHPTDIAEC